jgi:hypothetical protein
VRARLLLALVGLLLVPRGGQAQELDPGAYWPLPVGLNIVTVVNSVNWGNVTFDPSLPIDDGRATINSTVPVYTRALSFVGRSANLSVQAPIVVGHVEGVVSGVPTETSRFGPADPRVRFAVNLRGAPAMTPTVFASYRMRTIVGASITVAPPLGQYHNTKFINLGAHRWSIKSELGLSRAIGAWVVEVMGGAWFFTDNDDFVGGRTREQDPIGSAQLHLTYRFRPNMWLAADANFYSGGQTTIDGLTNLDLQRNARIGSTFSAAVTRHQAIRVSVSRGAYTTIGGDFTSIAIGYNYAWIR